MSTKPALFAYAFAEWKRVDQLNSTIVLKVFGDKVNFGVPVIAEAGVKVSVDATESADSLKLQPQDKWPPLVKTALALKRLLDSNIDPPQVDVAKGVSLESGTSQVVRISVGKKP